MISDISPRQKWQKLWQKYFLPCFSPSCGRNTFLPGRKPTLPHTYLRPPQSITAQRPDKQLNCKRRNPSSSVAQRDSRVNKHLRLDKIAIKGFSPEISSFVPFLPTVKNPHKSLHGKCPIFTKIQNGGQPT